MLYRTLKEGPPVYPEVMWVRMWEERHPASDKAQLPLPRAPVTHGHCVCPGQGQRELESTLLCRLRTPQQGAGQRPPGRQAGPKCPQKTDELSSWPSAHTPPPRGVKRDGTGFAQRRRVAQVEPAAAPLVRARPRSRLARAPRLRRAPRQEDAEAHEPGRCQFGLNELKRSSHPL